MSCINTPISLSTQPRDSMVDMMFCDVLDESDRTMITEMNRWFGHRFRLEMIQDEVSFRFFRFHSEARDGEPTFVS